MKSKRRFAIFEFLLFVLFSPWAADAAPYRRGTKDSSLEMRDQVGFSGSVVTRPKDTTFQWSTSLADVGTKGSSTSTGSIVLYGGLWGGGGFRGEKVNNILALSASPLVRVEIPADALPANFLPHVSEDPLSRPLRVSVDLLSRANARLKTMGSFCYPVDGKIWEVYVLNESGKRQSGLLAKPATITLPYTDRNRDGIVDGTEKDFPIRAETLAVWWLDEDRANWVKLPDSVVSTKDATVSTSIRHFSVFAVMGDQSFNVSDIHAYPVPFRPGGPGSGSGAGQTGTASGGITFKNLPSQGTIRIYTLGGELVKEISHTSGTGTETWNVKTDSGDDCATGTYIWSVESNGSRKTGKLAVVR